MKRNDLRRDRLRELTATGRVVEGSVVRPKAFLRRRTTWTLVALALLLGVFISGSASAVITAVDKNDAGATLLAQAMAAAPAQAPTGHFDAVPPNGTPNGIENQPRSGFPTDGSTFAILTSGDVNFADDANTSGSTGANDGGGTVRGTSDRDVTILRIDVLAPVGSNCLSIDFKFFSDEFPEFVGGSVSDSFVAELDTSNWTTTGGGQPPTAPNNFAFDANGNPVSINSTGNVASSAGNAEGTTYDGATQTLVAQTQITPGAHALYLSIFDQGDNVYDSAVFVDNLRIGTVANPATQCAAGAKPADDLLSLTKTDSPDPVSPGQQITYTATVTNNGDVPATNVTLTDQLPSNVTFVSATPSQGTCSGTATVTCDLGTIASSAQATVTIVVEATEAGTVTNTASVTATEPDPGASNNSATTTTSVVPVGAATLSINDISVVEGNEGPQTVSFSVSLSSASPTPVTVDLQTAPNTATTDYDFLRTGGTVTFAAGETSKPAEVTINGESTHEADETFFVDLSNPVGATIADGRGVATITNDDPRPRAFVSDAFVLEGNQGQSMLVFIVSLDRPSGELTGVDWVVAGTAGTATSGEDYASQNGTVGFDPGETSKSVTVPVNGDTTGETDETVVVRLVSMTNVEPGDGEGTGTITNDDGPPPPPPPVFQQTVGAGSASGTVLIRRPGASGFSPLDSPTDLPVGTLIDTTNGRVTISIIQADGTLQSADFYEGLFLIEAQIPDGTLVLALQGGEFETLCAARRTLLDATQQPPRQGGRSVRHLWGNGAGKFRTKGRYSSATVRGTTWLTDDRCQGTLSFVQEGSVTVADFVLSRSIILNAGQSYLAQPVAFLPRRVVTRCRTVRGARVCTRITFRCRTINGRAVCRRVKSQRVRPTG